jgi:hypothetical protein
MANDPDEHPSASPMTAHLLRTVPGRIDARTLGPAGLLLRSLLQAAYSAGEHAKAEYDMALRAARERAAEVVLEIARWEHCCREEDYSTRWGLIFIATELRHTTALPLLRTIVLTPIPAEKAKDPHASTVARETILRTTAAEGVGKLAASGNAEALETLFEFLLIPSLSVRRATVQSILTLPNGSRLRARVAKYLPPEQQFLMDLKRLEVDKAPQIPDPRKFVRKREDDSARAAPPDLPRGQTEQARGRAPRAGT